MLTPSVVEDRRVHSWKESFLYGLPFSPASDIEKRLARLHTAMNLHFIMQKIIPWSLLIIKSNGSFNPPIRALCQIARSGLGRRY